MRVDRTLPYHAAVPAFVVLLLASILPLYNFMPKEHWHDLQRLGQIALFVTATLFLLGNPSRGAFSSRVDSSTRTSIAVLLIGGNLSALSAHHPLWAFAEIGVVVGSLGLGYMIAALRQHLRQTLDKMLLATLFFICAALTLQFLVTYSAALVTGLGAINPWLLLDGFSNLRFYGQFISLSLPLLAVPLLVSNGLRRFFMPSAILLVLWWAIAFTTGTRGTWLGMLVAVLILFFLGKVGRSWAKFQIIGALIGLLVCFLWLDWLPSQFALSVAKSPVERMTASLSLREVIWQQAIDMIIAKPLWGFGPMHFADVPNSIAAHPHQAFLQWACEWGLPSAMLVTWLVWRALRSVFHAVRVRRESSDEIDVLRVCLLGGVLASLMQSMVDGVLVMPYTETWLALIGGWLFAIHPPMARTNELAKPWTYVWRVSLLISAVLLVFISVRDFPLLHLREERYAESFGGHLQPRFWTQGVISDGKLQK